MKVAELIEKRRPQWEELDRLCELLSSKEGKKASNVNRFSQLYRAACADLALAESYQLPPKTVDYLHKLVARSHNQLYRAQRYQWSHWYKVIFNDTPKKIFNDGCVHFVFILFWGLFLLAGYLAYEDTVWPGFADDVLGEEQLSQMSESFAGFNGRSWEENSAMFGFYIFNNAGIGLSCFVSMLGLLPGLVILSFNAVHLGSSFGYMFRPDVGDASINFQNFVTAHGPFELTAIILSAGAGLRIGLSWIVTDGMGRLDSLQKTAIETLPVALCATALFIMAAMIEGFISPTPEKYMPWWVKGLVAVLTSCMMMFYFVVLGYPRGNENEEVADEF